MTQLSMSTKVLIDAQGRRVPQFTIGMEQGIDLEPQVIVKLLGETDGLYICNAGTIPANCVDQFQNLLLLAFEERERIMAPQPPRVHVREITEEEAAKPKKPKKPKKPRMKDPHTHKEYDSIVFKGNPPEAPPGGWPEGIGVVKDWIGGNRDEHGTIGGKMA